MHRKIWVASLVMLAALSSRVPATAQGAKPAKDKHQASRWAVLVGVDDYTQLGKLRFAGNDQRAMAEQLIASGFPKDQVFLLHDKADEKKYLPFRSNIARELELVLKLAAPGDLVIVGFSGHGVQLEGKSYLCPLDADPEKLAATSIAMDDVYDRMARCKASLKLLLVDACRNDLLPVGRRSVALRRGLGDFDAKEVPPEGIMQLTSCGPTQFSMEDEKLGHGVFMHYVLQGLRGEAANKEGIVTLARLYDYASLETKKYVARKYSDYQTPALKGEISGPFEICSLSSAGKGESAGEIAPPLAAAPFDATTAKECQAQWARYIGQPVEATNTIGMKLRLIPPGEFQMGSSPAEIKAWDDWFQQNDLKTGNNNDEGPQHRVRITRPFYLAACHVTRGQFRQFVGATNYETDSEKDGKGGWGIDDDGKWDQKPEYNWRKTSFVQDDDHPVVNVSWNDAAAFCKWLSRKEAKEYRLPSEAEWEYACRVGTTTRYWCGDDQEKLAEIANVRDATAKAKYPKWRFAIEARDSYVYTSPVGSFRANPFGLYDMHGNAWQWCADWYGAEYYAASPVDDPAGPDSGSVRVLRGGCWSSEPSDTRSAERYGYTPVNRSYLTGFRVARTQ